MMHDSDKIKYQLTLTATLTAMPTISSEFLRTLANKNNFPTSTESACEGRLSRSEAERKTAEKARVEGMFLQVDFLQQAMCCPLV
jgi:hypothetical protein